MTDTTGKRQRSGPKPPCEKCGGRVIRVHRPRLVKIFLFWLPMRKYECLKCRRVVYKY